MFIQKYKQALAVILKKPIMLWGLSLLSAILGVIASIVTSPILILSFCATTLLDLGMTKVYLDGLKGKQVNSNQLFAAFNKNAVRAVGGMAWATLWVTIWAFVPIVGPILAIIKSYSYAFVPYILVTKPEVTATEALKLSMQMTKGKKGQMFLADFCLYAGIVVVSIVIALLMLIPILNILVGLIAFIFYVAVALFTGIFQGLYKAAFYDDSAAEAPAAE